MPDESICHADIYEQMRDEISDNIDCVDFISNTIELPANLDSTAKQTPFSTFFYCRSLKKCCKTLILMNLSVKKLSYGRRRLIRRYFLIVMDKLVGITNYLAKIKLHFNFIYILTILKHVILLGHTEHCTTCVILFLHWKTEERHLSKLAKVHLFLLAKSKDIKHRKTYKQVLRPLIEDLNILYKEGIKITVNGNKTVLFSKYLGLKLLFL